MGFLEAIFLGLLQGLTEFLPVSSSGHLVIAQHFLGVTQPGVTFEVMVHFGTLLSIVWVFRRDLMDLVCGFSKSFEQRRLLILLIVGMIPTGIMGFAFGSFFIEIFDRPLIVGFMLLVTGFIVIIINNIRINTKDIKTMSNWDAVIVGIFQGIAIIPGITRSGSTILGALLRGLNRETAIRYSFLLALPAIAGATLLELWELVKLGGGDVTLLPITLATLVAFFSGIFAIRIFINLLKTGKFYYIAYYCWFIGTVTLIYTLF